MIFVRNDGAPIGPKSLAFKTSSVALGMVLTKDPAQLAQVLAAVLDELPDSVQVRIIRKLDPLNEWEHACHPTDA